MIKTVKIGNKDIVFKSSAALPRRYRAKFNRDLFVDMAYIMSRLKEDQKVDIDMRAMSTFEDLAYTFAKYADPEGVPEDVEEWLEQFEAFDIFQIIPVMLEMWVSENKTTGTLKKKNGKSTGRSTRASSSTEH